MKAKKQKTFAQRAEKIMKKYEARPDDTAAQDSKNRELAVLKQEQEMYKQNRAIEAMETIQSMGYGDMLASNEPQQPQQGQPQAQAQQGMGQGQPSQEEMMAMQQQQAMMQQQGQGMPQEQQIAAYGGYINKYHSGGEIGHTHDDTKMGPNPYNNINAARENYEIALRKFKPKGFKATKYHVENLPEAREYREALRNAPKHVLEQYDINRSKHYSSPIEMLKDFDERNTTKTKAPIENYNIYDNYKASTDSLNELAFLEQQAELGKHTGSMSNNYDHFKDRADYANYKTDMSPALKKYYDDNVKRKTYLREQGFGGLEPWFSTPARGKGSSEYFSEKELKAKGAAEKAGKAKADKERAEYNKIVAAGGRNYVESKAYGGHMNRYAPGGDLLGSQLQNFYNDYKNVDLGALNDMYNSDPTANLTGNEFYPTEANKNYNGAVPNLYQTTTWNPRGGSESSNWTEGSPEVAGNTGTKKGGISDPTQDLMISNFLKAGNAGSQNGNTEEKDPLGNEMNPYAALAQGAGDAYGLAKSFQKYDPRTAEQLDHQRTDTTAQENAIDRQVASASATGREQDRRYSQMGNKASRIARETKLATDAGGAKADRIAEAERQDQRTNLGIDQYNIGQRTQADESNRGAKDARTMAQVQHMQNLGQTYAGYDKDSRANQYQNDVLNIMDTNNYEYVRDENGNLMAVPKS